MISIVEELRTNRESGAKRLESEYKAGLMTLARRFYADEGDAEELVNRTLAEVVSGIDNYLEQSAFFGWMCKILENQYAKDVRRKSNRMVVDDPGALDAAEDAEAANRIFSEVDAAILRDAIASLPDEMKDALMLRYFMDMPVGRVAKILSVPEGTVKWRLHCARVALAAKLGAAAKKPGGRALLLALALACTAALGAAVALVGDAVFGQGGGDLQIAVENPDGGLESVSLLSTFNFGLSIFDQPTQEENMNATTLRTFAASAAFASAAGAPLAASAATVYLNKSAEWAAAANAFSTASYWGDGSAAPGPGNDYVVANGLTLRVPEGEAVFAGDSLRIGEADGTSGRLKLYGNGTKQTFSSLVLANGSCFDERGGTKSETVAGPVTVTATEASPFLWTGTPNLSGSNSAWVGVYFEGPMRSAAGAEIVFADNGQPDYHVDLKGDMSNFAGTLEMRSSRAGFYQDSAGGTRLVIYPGSGSAMPGKLSFTAGTSLFPSDKTVDFSVGALQMAAGSRIRVTGDSTGAHSIFRVTDSFTFPAEDGGVFLEVSGLYKSADTLRTAIFSAPVSSGFTARTFRTAGDDGAAAVPRYTLECEDDGGIRTLYLVTKIVDPVNASGTASMNAPSIWASGVVPGDSNAANHDFYDSYKWIVSSQVADADRRFVATSTLTLGSGATFAVAVRKITIDEINLLNGAILADNGNNYDTRDSTLTSLAPSGLRTIAGTIRAPWRNWETANIVGRAGAWLLHDGALTGGGIVHLHNAAGASDAYYQLGGINTGFFGALKLSTDAVGAGRACLVLDDAANLGGPCKAYRADALTLSMGWKLWPRASMTLNEPTRGISIAADGVLKVGGGDEFAVAENILWNGGGIEKTGEGTFALGGAASVASGAGASAVLTVAEGAFKPLSTNALSGVTLAFGSGTSLRIQIPAADDGMRARGVSPASVSLPQGKVIVEFDVDAASLSSREFHKVAIVTVASEDAAQVRTGLEVAHSIAGFNVQLGQTDNGDGSATLFAWFGKGTVMIFR